MGTASAAILAMILSWFPNPFDPEPEDFSSALKGAKVRLFHSQDKQGLAAAIEIKLHSHGIDVEVGDNNYSTDKANIRYYVESDLPAANIIQNLLNSVAGEHPTLGVRFVVNDRTEANKAERRKVFHAYF